MENLTEQIGVLNHLFDTCEELKSNTYAVTHWRGQLYIQATYSSGIVQLMKAENGFEFNVKESGFVEAKKKFFGFDFDIEIVLT